MIEHVLQTSFNGGEVSQRLFGRTDAAIYDIAVAEATNYAPTVEGPMIKRSGSVFADLADTTAATLIPFEFNATQAYVLEFGERKVRFYANGALLRDGGGAPIVVAVPYTAADAAKIVYQQSADVLYLAHPSYPPAKLSRTGAASFVYAALALSGGPFADGNSDRSITVLASGTAIGASITLTASSAIFQPGHVDGAFQLQALDFAAIVLWAPGLAATAGMIVRWEGNVYSCAATGGYTGSTPPTHTIGTRWDGINTQDINAKGPYGASWTFLYDEFGQMTITATGNPAGPSTSATATVTRTLPASLTGAASWRWAFGRFSTQNGWPKHVFTWNARLCFATDFEILGSVVGDYLNFAAFDDTGRPTADMAFRFRMAGSNPINWVAADLQLILSTDHAEWSVGAVNSQTAPSNGNMQAVKQSHYGSIQVRPVQANLKTLFVQRGGRKVRESGFDYMQNRYVAQNMLVWCRHFGKSGIVKLGWQQESEEIVWALRGDGVLLMHSYSPEQQIKGWAAAPIAGFDGTIATVLDFAIIPSSDGKRDEVWILVVRGGIKTVERVADWWQDGAAIATGIFLDGALTYSGAPATHFSAFPAHYAGKSITVLADGYVVPDVIVANDGSFTLATAASTVCAGLSYVARIVTMPAKLPSQGGGASEMALKALKNVVMRVIDAAGLWSGQLGTGKLQEMFKRPFGAPADAGPPAQSGVSARVGTGGSHDRNGQVIHESRLPYPDIITMTRASFQVEEKE